jgi:hypothetical protein
MHDFAEGDSMEERDDAALGRLLARKDLQGLACDHP